MNISIYCLSVVALGFFAINSYAEIRIELAPKSIPADAIVFRNHPLLSPKAVLTTLSAELPSGLTVPANTNTSLTSARVPLADDEVKVFIWNNEGHYGYALTKNGAVVGQSVDTQLIEDASYVELTVDVNGKSIPIHIQAGGGDVAKWIRYFIPREMAGTWNVNGKPVAMALLDRDYDLDFAQSGQSAVLLDVNGDGEFDLSHQSNEILELGKPYQFGETSFELKPDINGGFITLSATSLEPTILQVLAPGFEAPNFKSEDFDGKVVKLSDLRGKFVFVDIWATWCGPCVAEIPNVQAASIKFKDAPIVFAGISIDDDMGQAVEFVEKRKLTYTQLWSEGGWQSDICKQYRVTAIPETFLVGPDGKLLISGLRGKELDEVLTWAAKYDSDEGKKFFQEITERTRIFAELTQLERSGRIEEAKKIVDDALAGNQLRPKDRRILERVQRTFELDLTDGM